MANGTWRIARRNNAQIPLVLAGLAAVLLLIAGKAHFVPFERARAAITDRTGSFLQALNAPAVAVTRWFSGIGHFFDVYSENQRLRDENARLLQWRGAALALQDRVKHYQMLLKTVPGQSYAAVTAQVIARSSQPFLETIVLNAGRRNGVRAGEAVVDARGLLGRIYVVGDHTSWVVLLNDLNSRIPVEVRPGNIGAILAGTNTNEPNLDALPPNARLKSGQNVVTSGNGGLLPAGLPVGVLALQGREAKVQLYADPLATDEVRILDFESPIEQMPKPADNLPVPAKLEPPPPPAPIETVPKVPVAPASPPQSAANHSGAQAGRTGAPPAARAEEQSPAPKVTVPRSPTENAQPPKTEKPADEPQDETNDQ
jgi:rod shape-determining protein MreC